MSLNATSQQRYTHRSPWQCLSLECLYPRTAEITWTIAHFWHQLFQEALWVSRLPLDCPRLTCWPLSQQTVHCAAIIGACVSRKVRGLRTELCPAHPRSLQLGGTLRNRPARCGYGRPAFSADFPGVCKGRGGSQSLQLEQWGWGLLEQTLDAGQQQECSEARADPTVLSQTGRTGTQASDTSTRAGRRPAGEHAENPL